MNQSIRNHSSGHIENRVTVLDAPTHISEIIAALELKYATNVMVTAMLGAIAEKVKEVPLGVQKTVAELLKANLDSHIENMGLMTAAIMAINPKNIIQVAANDEKFDIAA